MKKDSVYKSFVYYLCFSFVFLTGGFPRMAAEAAESGLPMGEMISRGEVKFEPRENVWKKVEPSHFPVFQGVRIKTEKGLAFVALANNSQVEAAENSLFSLQRDDQCHLFQGRISFRIPSGADMSFSVGTLSIGRPHPLQASTGSLVSPRSEETVGSIALHTNGSVTVKSIRGPLSIQNQDRVVLATISSKESVTLPSITASGKQTVMVAQVREYGEYPTGKALTEELLGLSKTTWMLLALGGVAAAGGVIVLGVTGDEGDEFILPFVPVCP
jgi:hypothetical protein